MAELTPKERLQPSLLDRLTDDEPERGMESRERRVLSPSQLRDCVRRDLAWLLNTTNLESTLPLHEVPEVAKSVLNYGVIDLAGKPISSINAGQLEKLIREAIWTFEPRLIKDSVVVKIDERKNGHNELSFVIEAQLWAQPLPLQLFLRTEIDLESGEVKVGDKDGMD
ncbi:MAG: type VI secretion system baseplate subunit TssE [Deltaproteobacteria bacterium]|nr:type VI secretion system baseplate subunit TssE [Deltaproteobacteria bacterium]